MMLTTLFAAALAVAGEAPAWGVAPDGSVWTGHSKRFQFAPTLAFPEVKGAAAYHSEIIDDFHETRTGARRWCSSSTPATCRSTHPRRRRSRRFVDVYEATRKPVYLAKARAIADAQTRMIEPDGFINTWSVKGVRRDDHRHHTWLNCTMEIMSALGRLASVASGS